MNYKKFKIISILSMLIISIVSVIGGYIYVKHEAVHPFGIITVFNPVSQQKTQAYGVNDLQIYISQSYRMDLPLFKTYVQAMGENNNSNFNAINNAISEDLALNKDNKNININPFIVRLTIKNLSNSTKTILADNFKIRTVDNIIYYPNMNWQQILDEAGFFAGTGKSKTLEPNEEKTLWLIYGTLTDEQKTQGLYQEYMQINTDSNNNLFATKYEFPFNYTLGYPINDYQKITFSRIENVISIWLLIMAIYGVIIIKIKDNFYKK